MVISHFGFEGETLVLIAPVPGHFLQLGKQGKILLTVRSCTHLHAYIKYCLNQLGKNQFSNPCVLNTSITVVKNGN